jgi:Fe-S cluster assembly iron-binding protein IscA
VILPRSLRCQVMPLSMTKAAADAIRALLEAEHLPETGGMHLTMVPGREGGEPELGMKLVPGGGIDDEEIREHGARVFLDLSVVEALDGQVLDAEPHGDHVHFTFGDAVG